MRISDWSSDVCSSDLQARNRLEDAARRADMRGWVMARRERTRHLIELGGLVQKAVLVELADDDRATLYGAMPELAGRVREDKAGDLLVLLKRRGRRAFDAAAVEEEDKQWNQRSRV